jgi:serine/threonine-protein kinase
MIDRTIAQYKILSKLGEGGMGTVYRGVDTMLDRPVAIKVLHAEIARQPEVIARFRSEATLLAKLNDPNIATLYAFLRDGDEFFMVMELVDGNTLASLMGKGANQNVEKSVNIVSKILLGLEHAHSLGIQHRDIKPANILITPQGAVKITDFGIARALDSQRLTRDQRLVGTLEYLAPERIKGEEGDLRSDLYSVGVVLYELLSGRLPFERPTDFELMRAHLEEPPLPLRDASLSIPPALESFVLRALAKRPEERFANAREMREALSAIDLRAALPETRFAETMAAALPETRFAETMAAGIPETRFAETIPGPPPVAPVSPQNAPLKRPPVKPVVWVGIAGGAALALLLGLFLLRAANHRSEAATGDAMQQKSAAPASDTVAGNPATAGGIGTPQPLTPSVPVRDLLPTVNVPPPVTHLPPKKENPGVALERGKKQMEANNPVGARESFRKAADGGNTQAMVLLGAMCSQGMGGEKNDQEAVRRFRQAAALGDMRGMFNLGLMYEANRGVPQAAENQAEAARWYTKALQTGRSNDAAFRLGIMYEQGRGVPRDLARASQLYRVAGTPAAMERLQRISN